ncbi:MAG: sigma-70 family RNA polymerase sigma factor [Actinomycetota bacterium]
MAGLHVDAVEAAYRRVHGRLWRALLAYCGDPDVASDAEAEAFVQAIARGDGIDDVERWVWRASFRIAAGLLTVERTVSVVPDRGDGRVPFSVVEFVSELSMLSPQQRACVVLRHVGGYSSAEIAEILDTSTGTVSVQLNRAHNALAASGSADVAREAQ